MRVNNLLKGAPIKNKVFGVLCYKLWTFVLLMGAILAVPLTAGALTTISQGYLTNGKLALGSIVSLKDNSSEHVDAAHSNNLDSILGVVVSEGNSLLNLTNGKDGQIQVATSGVVRVLASDINGEITRGDYITASPINAVGMKATSSTKVLGIAQAGISKNGSTKQTYKGKDGKEQSVMIGEVPVLVNVSYYYKQPDKTLIPPAIQNIANALAGKAVSPLPILVSMGIFIVTLIVVASLVYSMVKSSIISVGRNPMSQSAIYRGVLQLSALVVGILAVAMVSIYMVLTRF